MSDPRPENEISIRDIAGMLSARAKELCEAILPAGKQDGPDWRCGDIQGNPGQSLCVCLKGDRAGRWLDFETDERGDLLHLIAASRGISLGEAVTWGKEWLGITDTEPASARSYTDRRAARVTAAPNDDQQTRKDAALRLWRAAKPALGSLVETYLVNRYITIKPPASLRFHPGLRHAPTSLIFPTMVAGVQAPTGEVAGVHRTFLSADGRNKAQVKHPRMSLGRLAGGSVRLGPVGEHVAIAEGIENALSAMQAMPGLVAWAALSTTGMKAVVLPPHIRKVLILADADPPGEEAAQALADRLVAEDRTVSIAHPPEGTDFNDTLRCTLRAVP